MAGTCIFADNMGDTWAQTDGALMGWGGNFTSRIAGVVSGYAMRLTSTTGRSCTLWAPASALTVHMHQARTQASQGELFTLSEPGQTHIRVFRTADGKISVRASNGTSVLAESAPLGWDLNFHHLAVYVKIDNSAGEVQAWGDGVEIIPLTGSLDTRNGGTGVVSGLGFPAPGVNNGSTDYDNVHIWDGNDFKGDTRVIGQIVDDMGTNSDWTPSPSGTNKEAIDEATQDGDTTYNFSGTATDRDTFEFPAVGVGVAALVHAVVPYVIARKDDSGTRGIKVAMLANGTDDYDGSDQALNTGYSVYREVYEENPDTTSDWTVGAVEAMEYGYVLT